MPEKQQTEMPQGFGGFEPTLKRNYFKYPAMLESYWHLLTGAEQKVLDFILRQTYGYGKTEDAISLSQFEFGIGKRNKGTGLSRSQIRRSLASLEEKRFIRTETEGKRTKRIALVLKEEEAETERESMPSIASEDTKKVIEMFRGIAFHKTDQYLKDKREITAVGKLLELYSFEQLEKLVEKVSYFGQIQYAPRVYSPSDLYEKIHKVMRVIEEQEAQSSGPLWATLNLKMVTRKQQ